MTQPDTNSDSLPPIRRLVSERYNNGVVDMHRLECGHEVPPIGQPYGFRSCTQCWNEGRADD